MKIAIQGHPTRGKEIIQILESLGGINICNYIGNNFGSYYELHGNSITCMDTKSDNYKYYTLEEFEKEFPFKVGDKVITSYGSVGIIRALIPDNDKLPYCVETEKGYIYGHQSELKFYKEMERNITLTLDKAKEWYKKGGELREIALQAFSEKELNPLPRSWEEFCEKYPIKNGECWVGSQDIIHSATFPQDRKYKTWIPSRRSAEAHLAMIQLEQLRDCYRQGWIPDYDDGTPKYYIYIDCNGVSVGTTYYASRFLTFQDQIIATEFARNFLFLIKKAGDLI